VTTPEELVERFFLLKQELLKLYLRVPPETQVGLKVASLALAPSQQTTMKAILDGVLNDALYTVLLALDGEASMGGVQEQFKLYDESGNLLTGGRIEGAASEWFQGEE
jgi:hypothetical protein